MSKNPSNVIIHKLNFQSELSRIIPRMAEKGITEWVTYHPRATYGYVDVIDHSGASPVFGRYVLTTEGVGSKTPISKTHKLEVSWYGQNGIFEQEPPWEFSLEVGVKTAYSKGLEDFENSVTTLDRFIWNEANFYKWEGFLSTKEVIGLEPQ